MSSSTRLPTAALILGLAGLAAIVIGVSEAIAVGDLMGLGFVALGLFAGAAIGLVGVVLGGVALNRGDPGRGRAIAGVVLGAIPMILLAAVMLEVRLNQPPDLPLEPPAEPPGEPPTQPPAE